MDEEMVDEIIELGVALTRRPVCVSWERYLEFASYPDLVTSERELSSDLVIFIGCSTDIGIEFAREIGLDLSMDIVSFI